MKGSAMLTAFSLYAAGLTAQPADHPNLDHTKWRLIESNQQQLKIPTEIPFTITFERDSYFLSGCNLVSGKFRVMGQKLVVAGLARSTRKACPGEAQSVDTAFSRLFNSSPTFLLVGDRLTLEAGDGAQWIFQKEPLPSKDAKTKFVYVAAFTKNCTGVGPMTCLQVRDSKDRPWTLHDSGIVGFEHVPGIEYRLRIKEDRIAHPAADSSAVVWYLDAVIEQSVIDRQAADAYLASKPH